MIDGAPLAVDPCVRRLLVTFQPPEESSENGGSSSLDGITENAPILFLIYTYLKIRKMIKII